MKLINGLTPTQTYATPQAIRGQGMFRSLAVSLLLLGSEGVADAASTRNEAALNSSSVQSESIGLIENELLQLKQDSQLDAEVDSRLDSFIALDTAQKESILSSLYADEKSNTAAEWGFLKNIVNIDRFFSSGSAASDASTDSSSGASAPEDSEEETQEDRDRARSRALKRIRGQTNEELLKRNESLVNRRAKLQKEAELERLKREKAKQEDIDRLQAEVDRLQAAWRKSEKERFKAQQEKNKAIAAEEARMKKVRIDFQRRKAEKEKKAAEEAARKLKEQQEKEKREREAKEKAAREAKEEKERKAREAKEAKDAAAREAREAKEQAAKDKAEALRKQEEEARKREERERKAAEKAAKEKAAREEAERKRKEKEERERIKREEAERKRKEAEERRKAEEERKRKEREEKERIRKAAEEAARLKRIEEEKARKAAEAKAARLKKIKDDYGKRRNAFSNVIGQKFFTGTGKPFSKANQFHILTYFTESGGKKEEAVTYRKDLSFKTNSMKQAFITFGSKIRNEMAVMPLREFALIGNRKLLLTTSIFDDYFEAPIKKGENVNEKSPYKYKGDEFVDDRITHLFLGYAFQKFLLDWPEKTLDSEFEGYQVLMLLGKDGTWYKVGPSFEKATKVFGEKSAQEAAFVILTHTNGKWYKVSGPQNSNGLYTDAYLALSSYLQAGGNFKGPITTESAAGFRMKWQVEQEGKAKYEKLKSFYKGKPERLYKNYVIFGMYYDRQSHSIQKFNYQSYTHMRTGVNAVAAWIYNNIIRPERDYAYMALIRETVPLFCSEGDMSKKPVCQRMLGYAMFNNWFYADDRMINIHTSAHDYENYYYVAYVANSEKQGEVSRLRLDVDYAKSVRMYEDLFKGGKDAKFDFGIMGHSGMRKWWNPRSQYKGKEKNYDVYRLLIVYAQTKLDIYNKDANDEKSAGLKTLNDHNKGNREAFDTLKGLFKGNNAQLYKNINFFIATYDLKSNRISKSRQIGNRYFRNAYMDLANWAYNNIIRQEHVRQEWIFGVAETGIPFYCSEEFNNEYCRRLIGYSTISRWFYENKKLYNRTLAAADKEYSYVAYVGRYEYGKGLQDIDRVPLTKNLQESIKAYEAMFTKDKDGKQKYNVGVVGHTTLNRYYKQISFFKGAARYHDVYELLTQWAQTNLKIFNEVSIDEKGIEVMTTDVANAKIGELYNKVRSLYKGKNERLFRNYQLTALVLEKERNNAIRWLQWGHNSLQQLITYAANRLKADYFRYFKEVEFMFAIRQTGPFYCSVEKWDSRECRILIGENFRRKGFMLDDWMNRERNLKINNHRLNTRSEKFFYYGIVQNLDKNIVKKVKFTNNWGQSSKMFNELVGKNKEYDIGYLTNNRDQNNHRQVSRLQNDVQEMIGRWIHEDLKLWTEAPKQIDEKTLHLYTHKEYAENQQKEAKRIKDMYKGSGKGLYKRYHFRVAFYDKDTEQYSLWYNRAFSNMKQFVYNFADTYFRYQMQSNYRRTYLAFIYETQPFWCSEGKITEGDCRNILGYVLWQRYLYPRDNTWTNRHLASNAKQSYTFAVLRDKKEKKLTTINLSNNIGKARSEFNGIAKSKEGREKYLAGFVYSKRTGIDRSAVLTQQWHNTYQLVYELIGEYAQSIDMFKTADGWSEKAANIKTLQELQVEWNKELKTIKDSWKGGNDRLHRTEWANVISYNQHNDVMSHPLSRSGWNFQTTLNSAVQWIFNHYIRREDNPYEFAIFTRRARSVIYCSDGKVKESEICQKMIGYAVLNYKVEEDYRANMWHRDDKVLYDRNTRDDTKKYEIYSITADFREEKPKIVKTVYPRRKGNEWSQANNEYQALFKGGAKAKATTGILIDNRRPNMRSYWKTYKEKFTNYQDTYHMLGLFMQDELKVYTEEGVDYGKANLHTQKDWNDKTAELSKKLRGLYTGDGERLYKNHQFFMYYYDVLTQIGNHRTNRNTNNMKNAMRHNTNLHLTEITRNQYPREYLYFVQDSAPYHCTAGELTKPECRHMIGHAMFNRHLYPPRKIVDPTMNKGDKNYRFAAILKDNTGKVEKIELGKVQHLAQMQFKAAWGGDSLNQEYTFDKQKGFCVTRSGGDQNSGVIKLSSRDINTPQAEEECLEMCSGVPGLTGCEGIWHQGNRGCYAHTREVGRGNGAARHTCWVAKAKPQKESADQEKSKEKFYVAGFIYHTGRYGVHLQLSSKWYGPKASRPLYQTHMSEIYQLYAEYVQQEGFFKDQGTDEKFLKLKTYKEVQEQKQKELEALKKLFKGTGESLQFPQWFYFVRMDRKSRAIGWLGSNRNNRNLKAQYNGLMTDVYNQVINPRRNWALLLINQKSVPMWCSEGKMTDKECQIMIGQAYRRNTGWMNGYFHKKFINNYLPGSDPEYQYIAYVSKKDMAKVERVNLTSNWNYARNAYNSLFKGGEKRDWDIGIIAHTQNMGTWNHRSLLTGAEKNFDSYQLVIKYAQDELKLYTESGIDEKTAQVNTTKEWNEFLKTKWDKLSKMYTGKGEQLFKTYHFGIIAGNRFNGQTSQVLLRGRNNLRQAFADLNGWVHHYIHKSRQPKWYLYFVRETGPFHCSEGELSDETCQNAIGYAVRHNYIYPDKKLVDQYISSSSAKYHFVGYMREAESKKVVKVDLVRDQSKAKAQYEAMVGKGKKYDIAIMGHTAIRNKWVYPITQMFAYRKNFDAYQLIAIYAQKTVEIYKDSGYDEKALKLVTRREVIEKQQKALKKLQELYKGKGERLYKSYTFFVAYYDRKSKSMGLLWRQNHWTLKTAHTRMVQSVFNSIIRNNQDRAFTFQVAQTVPYYCSDGDLDKGLCQRLIGYTIHTTWQRGDHKMYDRMISNRDVNYQYVAYLRKYPKDEKDDKDKGEIVRMNLTNNWSQAVKRYNSLFAGAEKEYYCGVISHTQRQQFWNHKTRGIGNMKNMDIYEMLAEHTQKEYKNFTKSGVDEKTANLRTKKDWDETLKKEFDKLKDLNKATTQTLFKHYTFIVVTYGRKNHYITQRHYRNFWNMKQAMQSMANAVYNNIVKPEKDEAFLFLVRQTQPFYCSEGDLDKKLCQRMIGHAIVSNWLIPEKKMVNRYLSSASRHYKHVAYLIKDDDTVVKMNLTKNLGQSRAQFTAFVKPEDSEYKAGIIGHTARNSYWDRYSALPGAEKNMDCLEAIAKYAQKELKLYKESGTDEKAAKVLFRDKMDDKHKSALKKMREIYTGKGERLYKQYIFYAVTYDKNTHGFARRAWSGHYTMRAAMNTLVSDIYNNVVRHHREKAYAFFVHQTVPFHCSEGKLDTVLCKRMIGYALRHNYQKADKKMLDRHIRSNDLRYQYIAYVKNDKKKDAEVKMVNLTNNWSAAVSRYNQLVKGANSEYNVGILAHSVQQSWWYPMTQKTGRMAQLDVYEMLADYCQKKLEIWKEDGGDEKAAKLKLKSEWDEELKKHDTKLKGLFKGSGDTLHIKYTFSVIFMHKRSFHLSLQYNRAMWSMRNAMTQMTQLVYQRVYRAEQDYAWLFTVRQTVPIYCSEEDLTKPECRRMLGWAMYHKYFLANKKMVDTSLTGARRVHVAYLKEKDGDKVIAKNLTQNTNQARKVFLSFFQGEEQKYSAGVFSHSAQHYYQNPVSALKGAEKNLDVYELIATFAQEKLKLYTKDGLDEKDAKLVTKKEIQERRAKQIKALNEMWKGKGERLVHGQYFYLAWFNPKNQAYGKTHYHQGTLKQFHNSFISWVTNNVINRDRDWTWIAGDQISGIPLACSNKDMKSDTCRQLLGYGFAYPNIAWKPSDKVFPYNKVTPYNEDNSINKDYTYITVVKDTSKKDAKLEEIKLNTTDRNAAIAKHKELVDFKQKDSAKIGFLTMNSAKVFSDYRSRLTENGNDRKKNMDVMELIGEWIQSRDDRFEKAEFSEKNIGIPTYKERMDEKNEKVKKISTIWKETGKTLVKTPYFCFMRLKPFTAQIWQYCQSNRNIAVSFRNLANYAGNQWQNLYDYKDYVEIVYERNNGVPIWCNKGKFSEPMCTQVLSFATVRYRTFRVDRSISDYYTPGNSEKNIWTGYFMDKEKKEVIRKEYNRNAGTARNQYEADWRTNKYSAAILNRPQGGHFERYKSSLKNVHTPQYGWFIRQNWDAESLIIKYAQSKGLYKDEGMRDNAAAKFETTEELNARQQKFIKTLRDWFKGTGDRLYKQQIIYFVTLHKRYSRYSYGNWRNHYSLKNAVTSMQTHLWNKINTRNFMYDEDFAWLIIAREDRPLKCSEKEFSDKYCRMMIGYAMKNNWLWAPKKMIDTGLRSGHDDYQYIGYTWDNAKKDTKVIKHELGNNYGSATAAFLKMVRGNQKNFTTGIMGHSAQRSWWHHTSEGYGLEHWNDLHEMLGKYVQEELKEWEKECDSEKSCKLMTKKEYDKKMNERLGKIRAGYKGKGEQLVKNYLFYGLKIHKTSNQVSQFYGQNVNRMSYAFQRFEHYTRNNVIRPYSMQGDYHSWMLVSRESVPLFCSESDDFTNVECKRMIGYAIKNRKLWLPKEVQNRKQGSGSKTAVHFAIVKKDAKADPELVMLEKDHGASVGKFKDMLKKGADQKYQIGIMGHTRNEGYGLRYPTHQTKEARGKIDMENDIHEMLADYVQKTVKKFLKPATTEEEAKLRIMAVERARAVAQRDAIKALYKGQGQNLHRHYRFSCVLKNMENGQIIMAYNGNFNNMRTAIHNIANSMYGSYFNGRIYARHEWAVASNERGIVGCSKDLESPECMQMFGAMRFYNYFQSSKISYKLANTYLNGNHPDRYYYMIASHSERPKEEFARVNLTRNWGAANAKFNQLCHKDPKQNKKYNTCILLSSAHNTRWSIHTQMTGTETYQDVFVLLNKYMRKMVPEMFTKVHNDEKSLNIKTQSEWNTFINDKKTALKKMYTGDGDNTARNENFRLVAYDKYAVNFGFWYNTNTRSMRQAINLMVDRMMQMTYQRQRGSDYTVMMLTYYGNAFFCSTGDMKHPECQKTLGYSVAHNWMMHDRLLFNSRMDGNSKNATWFAVLKTKDGKIERQELDFNHGKAIAAFEKNFQGDQKTWKYACGAMSNNRYQWWTGRMKTSELGNNIYKNHDVYTMIGEYVQSLGSSTKVEVNEDGADVEQYKDMLARTGATLKKLNGIFKGNNQRLHRHDYLNVVVYNKFDQTMRHQVWRGVWNLGNEMRNAINQLNNQWIRNAYYYKEPAFFFSLRYGGPMWCSEGKFSEKLCKMMMGYALRDQRLYLPIELTNPYTNNAKSSKRGYTVVAREKESGKIEKRFTRESGKSNNHRNEIIRDKKYSMGFRFWPNQNWAIDTFKTELKGRESRYDTYELIAEFVMNNVKKWTENAVSEKELNVISENEWTKQYNDMRTKLRKIYNGDGSNLFRNELWSNVIYDKGYPRIWINQHFWRNNMRSALHTLADNAANYIRGRRERLEKPFVFMFTSRNGGVHYCSAAADGMDLTNKDCQRMMGWAMISHQNYFTPQRRGLSTQGKGLLDEPSQSRPIYFALVADKDGKVERKEFDNNQNNAKKQLENIAGEGKKYTTGALLRNHPVHLTLYKKISGLKFENDGMDIYEMFAKYLQDQGLYKKATTNEKDSGLETHRLRQLRHKATEERMIGPFNFGKQPRAILQDSYLFRVYYMDMKSGRAYYNNVVNTNNWYSALQSIKNAIVNGKIKRDQEIEFMLATQQGNAFYCSTGMDTDVCRRLIGYGLRANSLKYRPMAETKPVFFNLAVPEHEQRYFAIVKDLKTNEVKKYQLTMSNQGKAQNQFKKLTEGADKIGSLGRNERGNPRWIQHKTKDGYKDVELALAQYAQQKLGMFKDNTVSLENAELVTRDTMNKRYNEYIKMYTDHVKQMQKTSRQLQQLARADKKLGNRYVKPIFFTHFSIRDGFTHENVANGRRWFSDNKGRAQSQKQLLELVSRRIMNLANQQARQTGNAFKRTLRKDGRARTTLGTYEHIVVLSNGKEPRILYATEELAKSTKSQILLGYIYANLDPQGSKNRWWRDNRNNLLKFHTFKYMKKPVATEDGNDYHKTFSVYESREDGKFTVNPCKGTESKANAGAARTATANCLKVFNKETNPARSDKNVRGFFVSNGAFIFSKYEETPDMANLNKAELPAYGALGRWLLKTIPEELRTVGPEDKIADTKSLVQSRVAPMTIAESIAPTEGLFVNPSAKFIYSAFTQQGEKKDVIVQKRPSHSLGAIENDLNGQDFWLNLDTEDNFNQKSRRQTTGLVFVENGAKLFPVATNKQDVKIDSRDSLIAMGAVLAQKTVTNEPKNANLFDQCLDQSVFNGKYNMIYEDAESGDVKREECEFCQALYQQVENQLYAKTPEIKNMTPQRQVAMIEKQFEEELQKTILNKKDFQHGVSVFNTKNQLMSVAQGSEDKEVYFALAKYGQVYCKNLQQVSDLSAAGLKGQERLAG